MAESSALLVDRRGLLAGAGALALSAALPTAPAAAAARPSAALTALTAQRAATARHLARALRGAGDPALRDLGPRAAARRLSAWLARQPAATRTQADAVLDLVAHDGVPSIAAIARATPPADAGGARRAAALAAAVGLLHTAAASAQDADEVPDPLAVA